MPSFHHTEIIGHLGRDPEERQLPSGRSVCNFNVAVSDKWKGKDGQQMDHTEWYRCNAFGKTAELVAKHFTKGEAIMCIGKMRTRGWEDKNGNQRQTTELLVDRVVFLGNRRGQGGGQAGQRHHGASVEQGGAEDYPAQGGFDADSDVLF